MKNALVEFLTTLEIGPTIKSMALFSSSAFDSATIIPIIIITGPNSFNATLNAENIAPSAPIRSLV